MSQVVSAACGVAGDVALEALRRARPRARSDALCSPVLCVRAARTAARTACCHRADGGLAHAAAARSCMLAPAAAHCFRRTAS
jgi:hypothetical protein